jgi:hypothetical protein
VRDAPGIMGNCLSGRDNASGSPVPAPSKPPSRVLCRETYLDPHPYILELYEEDRKRSGDRIRIADELHKSGSTSIPITPVKGYAAKHHTFISIMHVIREKSPAKNMRAQKQQPKVTSLDFGLCMIGP